MPERVVSGCPKARESRQNAQGRRPNGTCGSDEARTKQSERRGGLTWEEFGVLGSHGLVSRAQEGGSERAPRANIPLPAPLPSRSSTLTLSSQTSSLFGLWLRAFSSRARALIRTPACSSRRELMIQRAGAVGHFLTPTAKASRAPEIFGGFVARRSWPCIMWSLPHVGYRARPSRTVAKVTSGVECWRSNTADLIQICEKSRISKRDLAPAEADAPARFRRRLELAA